MARMEILKTARPNGWYLQLTKWTEEVHGDDASHEEVVYEVGDGDPNCDPDQFDTLAEAEASFEKDVVRLSEVRNWEAQARYDEQWGTDNGFSEWDLRAREY